MKRILSNKVTSIVLIILSALVLAALIFVATRPVSYGMEYRMETVYEGYEFEGTIIFEKDGYMTSSNSNFEEEREYRYYLKDGYYFFMSATADEEYDAEVEYINNNFDEALNTPFYAEKINAFKIIDGIEDDLDAEYICKSAIVLAISLAIACFVLIALSVLTVIMCKKSKQ